MEGGGKKKQMQTDEGERVYRVGGEKKGGEEREQEPMGRGRGGVCMFCEENPSYAPNSPRFLGRQLTCVESFTLT